MKSYLLPDKRSKRKTKPKKDTLNPHFDEVLEVRRNQYNVVIVHISDVIISSRTISEVTPRVALRESANLSWCSNCYPFADITRSYAHCS